MAEFVPSTVFAELVPYRLRRLHQAWAWFRGYFWLPCPLCGRFFGGHEWRIGGDGMPSVRVLGADGLTRSMGICPACVSGWGFWTRAGFVPWREYQYAGEEAPGA